MTLADVLAHKKAQVKEISGSQVLVDRLFELGFHKGLEVEVEQKLAFGGGLVVRLGAGAVALRETEAQCVEVSCP